MQIQKGWGHTLNEKLLWLSEGKAIKSLKQFLIAGSKLKSKLFTLSFRV